MTRQFRDLPKDRVTALLAAFPKLASSGAQHTMVEENDVRYVYQPIEEMYLVLITNLQSNILEDIETLHLLGQVVSSVVRLVDEREILANCFEILSAFDEAISLGYRENLSISQIKTFLEMESHEEKIHEIIERNKELEAAEERKLRAKQLDLNRREMAKQPGLSGFGPGSMTRPMPSLSSSGPSFGSASISSSTAQESTYNLGDKPKPRSTPMRGKGLQLGKKKTGALQTMRNNLGEAETSLLMENASEVGKSSTNLNNSSTTSQSLASSQFKSPAEVVNDGIHITIKEEISAVIERMGSVKSSEVKGSLQLRIADPDLTSIHILVSADGPMGQYRTHPNVDKAAFLKEKVIKLKDSNRTFPANNQQLSVLRWQFSNKIENDSSLVPLEFHCWFVASDESGHFNCIVEYELKDSYTETLENVRVKIPLMTGDVSVSSSDETTTWNQYDDGLEWIIPEIVPGTDSTSGSFEWTAEASSEDEFFPMAVEFTVQQPLTVFGQVEVLDVISAQDESESMPFGKDVVIYSENFAIV